MMVDGRDLLLEYTAALRGARYADLAPLVAAGIGSRALALACPAIDRIERDGALYRPTPDGGVAYIIPMRADDQVTPETPDPDAAIAGAGIVDLLAFDPARPTRWALRLGIAEWLGAVEPQYMEPDPVPIRRTPMAWLRSGCRGLVLLSLDPVSNYRLLSMIDVILAEDERHAADLRTVLDHPWPRPPVLVRGASNKALIA